MPEVQSNPGCSNFYEKIYQADKDKEYNPVSQHAIVVYRDNIRVTSAILLAAGGATTVTRDGVIIDENNLITRCCNKVFSLTLFDLRLNWVLEIDWVTCFSIRMYGDTYITHGEMSIARIDKTGKILWSYEGADIFVSRNEGTSFEMYENYIAMTDFNGGNYKIDYDGNTLNYEESDYHKQKPVTVLMKSQKRGGSSGRFNLNESKLHATVCL